MTGIDCRLGAACCGQRGRPYPRNSGMATTISGCDCVCETAGKSSSCDTESELGLQSLLRTFRCPCSPQSCHCTCEDDVRGLPLPPQRHISDPGLSVIRHSIESPVEGTDFLHFKNNYEKGGFYRTRHIFHYSIEPSCSLICKVCPPGKVPRMWTHQSLVPHLFHKYVSVSPLKTT